MLFLWKVRLNARVCRIFVIFFFKNEHLIAKDVPQLYKKVSEKRQPKPRGDNTISDMMTKLRTFFIWCYKNDLIQNNGDGKLLHASSPSTGVRIDDINSKYYTKTYVSARRIIE